MPHTFYYFSFVKKSGEKKYIMVDPLEGKIVEIDDLNLNGEFYNYSVSSIAFLLHNHTRIRTKNRKHF